MLFCDLDGFKAVNDTWGHPAGDRVLLAAADRIRVACREADRVGRLGGDEFVVILEDLHDPAVLQAVAERIIAALAEPVSVGDELTHVGISVGATLSREGDEPAALLTRADAAMYAAKADPSSTWVPHGEGSGGEAGFTRA